jgi:predicted transcriptional regulator
MYWLHMKAYTFQITEELREKLRKFSKIQDRSQSWILRDLIKQHCSMEQVN